MICIKSFLAAWADSLAKNPRPEVDVISREVTSRVRDADVTSDELTLQDREADVTSQKVTIRGVPKAAAEEVEV